MAAPGFQLLLSSRTGAQLCTVTETRSRLAEFHPLFRDDHLRATAIRVAQLRTFFTGSAVASTVGTESTERPSLLTHRPTSTPPLPSVDDPPASHSSVAATASYSAGVKRSDSNGPGTLHGAGASSGANPTGSEQSAWGAVPAPPQQAASAAPYNEPKDGSFSGRIVQHDGSHAVHLLVGGTGARDYNLRMVRCHASDDLLFGGSSGASASCSTAGAAAASAAAGGHGAVVRGENVPFRTFVYRQFRDTISATFLPAGYPETTGQNYVRFMCWQGVNNIAVTANSVLASTFMLYAVGLGAGSIPTAGALNWVLKDGMGQLGTLLFGKTIAHNFDVHSKTWFFLSAVMLQAAAALELLTVLVPEHFLLMGSLANTLKGLAWMAAGSTRSVFHLSFARDNNIADVTAKGTSQFIFASLVGTAGGALMCAAVGQSGAAAATCFGALAAAAVGSAYMTVQAIPLTTLNATRLQLLVDAFLDSISPSSNPQARRHGGDQNSNSDRGNDDANEEDEEEDSFSGDGRGRSHVTHRHSHGHFHSRDVVSGGDHELSDRDGGGNTAERLDSGGGGSGRVYDSGHRRSHGQGERDRRREGAVAVESSGGDYDPNRRDGDDEGDEDDEWHDGRGGGGGRYQRWRSDEGPHDFGRGADGGSTGDGGSGSARRWYQRPRVYRTVDRCYIGPSFHEYEMMYDDSLEAQVPTPLELSPLDPPLPYFSGCAERLSPPIVVGSRLEHVVDGNANLLVMLLTAYKYAHFIVLPRRGSLHVVLHEKADPRDMVQAYLQACILRRRLRSGQSPFTDSDEQTAELRLELQESLAAAERLTTIFMSTVQANGWTVSKIVVEAQRRRARW